MVVSGLDDEFTVGEDTLMSAFEYALGRKSYVVSLIVRDLMDNAELVSSGSRKIMIAKLKERKLNNDLGHEIDKQGWLRLLDLLTEIQEESL